MNCGNCGTPLIPGNNTCPSCGALNMPLNTPPVNPETPQEETLESLDNTINENQVEATTEAPTLDVKEEVLENETAPIQESVPTTTYEETVPQVQEPAEKVEDIKIDIPPATSDTVQVDQSVQAGGVGEVATTQATAGADIVVPEKNAMSFKIGGKTLKIKMGKFNIQKAIVFVAVFALGLFMGYLMFSNRTTTKCIKSVVTNKSLVSNGKNNETYINGYKYKIPTTYTYDKTNSGIVVYDADQTFKMYIRSLVFKYDEVVKSELSLRESLINNQYKVEDIKELIFNEHGYIVITLTTGMNNRMIGITDAGDGKVFYIEIVTVDNNYNTDIFNAADDIIHNAEATNDITQVEKLTIKDLSELIVTTARADTDLKK
jgi:uncharacterized Zn finger protein (UPF0148 family)